MPAIVDPELCNACSSCVDACPSNAIAIPETVAVVNQEDCIDCKACEDACTSSAIKVED